jgi:hypothetical protein
VFFSLYPFQQSLVDIGTCARAIFKNTACDLAQMDRFACFRWDKVEWAIWDLDEAVETNAGGSHDVQEWVFLALIL